MSHILDLVNQVHTQVGAIAPPDIQNPPWIGAPFDIKNPLDGITPDFTVFGAKFDALWKKLIGGAWAIALLLAIVYLMRGIVGIAQHRGGNHPSQLAESRTEAVRGGISVGALAALGVIVGAILAVTA